MTRPIAIFSALDIEIESLVTAADETRLATNEPARVWTGRLDGRDVVLVRVGLGKVSVAVAAGMVMQEFDPTCVVFTGVAGGVNPDLHIGDVVIGELSLQHDTGLIEGEQLHRYQAGHLPFFNPTDDHGYVPSAELLEKVRDQVGGMQLSKVGGRTPQLIFGTIVTGDQFVNDAAHREVLRSELGADAVEMEGAALAQAAGLLAVDHLLVRSLSDLAGEGSTLDFAQFVAEASANSAAVVRRILPVL